MTKRNFPNWITAYLEYTRFSESPSKFHFWTAVSVLAGALRRRVWIDQRYFVWIPNFYIIFVARPGIVSKSTTADIGMSLLREVPGIHFGPNSLTWQALIQAMHQSVDTVEIPATGEIFASSAFTIVASELGSLLDFSDRAMIDVFVDLWDGRKVWSKRTKLDGEELIENPFINIVGCTTDAWIGENFSKYLLGGGFTSRTIFVYGKAKRHLVAYPADQFSAQHSSLRQLLIQDLEAISQLSGEYTLTAEAKQWGSSWYQEHNARYTKLNPADEGLASFLARKQTFIHKLSMIVAASQRDELIITLEDIKFAAGMVSAIEQEIEDVFGKMGERDNVKDTQYIAAILAHYGGMSQAELFRYAYSRMGKAEFAAAIESLSLAGYIKLAAVGQEIQITWIQKQKAATEEHNIVLPSAT